MDKLNQDEREMMEICLPLWESWLEDIQEKKEGDSFYHMAAAYTEHSKLPDNSPFSLMFAAFCGGIEKGVTMIQKLEQAGQRSGKTA